MEFTLFLIVLVSIVVYFLPLFIAVVRSHPNAVGVSLLNLLLGWTLLGWIGSLIWACAHIDKGSDAPLRDVKASVLDQLKTLQDLRERGAITDAEFETQKRRLFG